jgi:uncharacterized protein
VNRLRWRLDAGFATHVAAKSLNQFADAAPFQAMKVDPRSGISERVTDLLRVELHRFPKVRTACLHGSRPRGDYSPQSDIDIAIDAPDMTQQNFAQIWSAIDASPLAYQLDCIWLQALPESPLKVQVERDGLVF